ncbi:thaumatin-like protein 1 [Capsella rubella]|uniref:thaumatin-like protein 1 n=1 Tax=Capsella rubella TaxID=81985 RepID=UPI000CD570B1|nr:thaumatin-like protein 1 [Capsella rubella]
MVLAKVSSFLFVVLFLINGTSSTTFTVVNQCSYTVWPGLLSGAGTAALPTTGFSLNSAESRLISMPAAWSGRIWGRTLCNQNETTGRFSCVTGDCGSSQIECSGAGANPPATLAEFTLNGADNLDFYDVSLVDGYNVPMTIVPSGGATGAGKCNVTGCAVDLNSVCPEQLKVTVEAAGTTAVACKSACEAFGTPEYCCSGAFATPDTCKPSEYSGLFKKACPTAYSYAYDDGTSTFTCSGADYVITFCPSTSSKVMESAPPRPKPEAVSVFDASATKAVALPLGVLAVAVSWVWSGLW